jgi:hypothetical protein
VQAARNRVPVWLWLIVMGVLKSICCSSIRYLTIFRCPLMQVTNSGVLPWFGPFVRGVFGFAPSSHRHLTTSGWLVTQAANSGVSPWYWPLAKGVVKSNFLSLIRYSTTSRLPCAQAVYSGVLPWMGPAVMGSFLKSTFFFLSGI